MAITFYTVANQSTSSQTNGSTSNNFTITLTSGRGALFHAMGRDGGSLDFTSITLSGGAGTVTAGPATHRGNGIGGRWFYISELLAGGSLTVTVAYDGGTSGFDINVQPIEITGHDLSSGFDSYDTDTNNPVSFSFSTVANNAGVVFAVAGGAQPASATGYTAITTLNGAYYDVTLLYKSDVGAAGSQSISPSAGYYGYAVAIKTAAGGATTKPAYYYAQL